MNHIPDFLKLLRELQKINPEFPLQYAVCLGVVSLKEGLSVTELSDQTNLPLSTVSRIVGALSTSRQRGEPYGLIYVKTSKLEKRRKEIYLSTKGKIFIESIDELMRSNKSAGKTTNGIAQAS